MNPKPLHIAAALLTLLAAGCAAKSNKSPVEGQVTIDGQPVAQGTIQFLPLDGKGQTAGGMIRDGRYSLESSPGEMRVVISAPKVISQRKAYDTPDSPTIDEVQEQLPARYSGPESELRANVESGQENKADFMLKIEGGEPPKSVF
ncbi:MAG TPA: hypothetical protein VHC19_25380 [Pirellulales bacterium]|jgi:hypothetical protein|nr:hypothetical protein [Pirellulales bacterium]